MSVHLTYGTSLHLPGMDQNHIWHAPHHSIYILVPLSRTPPLWLSHFLFWETMFHKTAFFISRMDLFAFETTLNWIPFSAALWEVSSLLSWRTPYYHRGVLVYLWNSDSLALWHSCRCLLRTSLWNYPVSSWYLPCKSDTILQWWKWCMYHDSENIPKILNILIYSQKMHIYAGLTKASNFWNVIFEARIRNSGPVRKTFITAYTSTRIGNFNGKVRNFMRKEK